MLALWNRSAAGAETEAAVAARLFEVARWCGCGASGTRCIFTTRADWPTCQRGVRRPADVVGAATPSAIPPWTSRSSGRGSAGGGFVAGARDAQPEGTACCGRCRCRRRCFRRGAGCSRNWCGSARRAMRAGTAARRGMPIARIGCRNFLGRRRPHGGKRRTGAALFSLLRPGERWRISRTGAAAQAGQAKAAVAALGGGVDGGGGRTPRAGAGCSVPGGSGPNLFDTPPEREAWPVRMLGRFDPILLAHKVKDWIVAPPYYSRVWRPAGHIEATVLEHGQAVATWRYDRIGAGQLAIRVFPFRPPSSRQVVKEVRRQAKEIAPFFALKLMDVRIERFPATKPA